MNSITDRLDRVQKIAPEYLKTVCPAPISVKIELTPRCNYHCKFCALMDRYSSDDNLCMDMGLFQNIAQDMREEGIQEIGLFFIGEPFMNPDLLIDSIRFVKRELGFPYVFLTSNASIAYPRFIEACMDAGLDSLKWSCNAADKKQFEDMMGVPAINFQRACHHIREAHYIREKKGFTTRLYSSSIMYDEKQSSRMSSLLEESILPYVDQHYWLPLYTMATAGDREAKLGLTPVPGNPGRCDSLVPPLPCWLLFTSAHVMADGRLTACGYDSKGDWEVGDLKSQSFMEAWNSEKFQALREAHLRGDVTGTQCAKCLLI